MNWTKLPTNILINRLSDQEIASIVKYQLLWAELEYQPDDKTCLRYMTNKQLIIAKQWLNAIETQVKRDIQSVETNRRGVKTNYLKNKEKVENLSISLSNSVSDSLEQQIRLDKNKEINKEKDDSKKFIKPTVEEIARYCQERNNNISAEQFYDFYESKGWRIGKSPMKDWKATVRNWERKSNQKEDFKDKYSFF